MDVVTLIRRTPLARGGVITRKAPMKRRARKPSDFARVYGSRERVRWVKSQPCCVCDDPQRGESENAHVVTGGTARKADARFIIPLCRTHHRELHRIGHWSFQERHGIDLLFVAALQDAVWNKDCARRAQQTEAGQ